MTKIKRPQELIPRWEMPSDPVKAVFWFTHWLLKILVRFFWLPIIVGVIYEGVLNGLIGGLVTLAVGLLVWVVLSVLLVIFNVTSSVRLIMEEANRFQQYTAYRQPFDYSERGREGKVVEGTIVDLEEKRRERNQQ